SSQKLDAGLGWLNNATITNNGTYLWTNIPTTLAGHAASIWAQINLTDNTVVQSGQVADPTADILYPSIAANDNGDAVIGYTKVSSSLFASIFANARLGTDAPGTLQGETLLHSGSATYSDSNNTSNVARWGDYSNTVVDPSDPNKFWTYQEY